jgi:hypothetical protein
VNDFQYGLQRPDGTHQVVNEQNPVPVTVRALPQFQDVVIERIDQLARDLTAATASGSNRTGTELIGAASAICSHLKLNRKATIWCAVGLALLQVALILAVVFVR